MGVQIFEAGRLGQIGDAQSLAEADVFAVSEFVLQEQGEAVLEAQGGDVRVAQLALHRGEHA